MKASRDRKKAKEIEEGKRDAEGHIIKQNQNAFDSLSLGREASNTHLRDLAFTTNYSQERTRKRKIPTDSTNSLKNSVSLPVKRRYKNWFHPHIWPAIDMAGKQTNYSFREIVKYLQSQYRDTNLYDSLAPSTVSGCIDLGSKKRSWNERVQTLVEAGKCWNSSRKYKNILEGNSELFYHIKETLLGIREVSLTINANLARSIFIGLIEAEAPNLLGDEATYKPRGHTPIFSLATTRRFLQNELNWTSRKETKDGQKTPENWEEICKKTFFRFFYTVRREDISKYLIFNVDQTGVLLVPGGNENTYKVKGAKQVPIHGKEEK